MEQKLNSEEWIAEHVARQSCFRRVNYAMGIREYKVEKSSDVWIMTQRIRWWHPVVWVATPILLLLGIIVMVLAWPFAVFKVFKKTFKLLFEKKVVDCIAIENIQAKKEVKK